MPTFDETPAASADAMAKILFRSGRLRGRVYLVEGERLTIGRHSSNDIVLRDDVVSSRHAIIGRYSDEELDETRECDGAGPAFYWVEDAGSKNGTFLGDRRVEGRVPVREGDVVSLARKGPEFLFSFRDASELSLSDSSTLTVLSTSRDRSRRRRRRLSSGVAGREVQELVDRRFERFAERTNRTLLLAIFGIAALVLLVTAVILLRPRPAETPQVVIAPSAINPDPAVQPAGHRVRLDLTVQPIYASLFLSYREGSVGRAEVENSGRRALSGAELEFELYRRGLQGQVDNLLVEDFRRELPELAPGETTEIELAPAFSNNILFDTDQEVTAEIKLRSGGVVLASRTRRLMVFGRHVMNWQIPEQIGAFIDSEDPVVRAFVNATWGARPDLPRGAFPPRNTVNAITLLAALTRLSSGGLRYLPDAQTPSTFASTERANDRVKYPGETLREGTGDCDDLSVLCCSLLKAVGVPAAVVVGSDHVLFMFDTGLDAHDHSPFDEGTVVTWKGRIWMPVESTSLARPGSSFLTGWSDAWKRCEAISGGAMRIVGVQEAWKRYRPLRPASDGMTLETIQSARWVKKDRLLDEVSKSIEELRQLYLENLSDKVAEVVEGLDGLEREQALGLYYARCGLYLEARGVFEAALFGEDGAPRTREEALSWNGRIGEEEALLLGDLAASIALGGQKREHFLLAAGIYELALRFLPEGYPERAELMMRLGLTYRLSGDLAEVKTWTSRAFALDPGLEATFDELVRGDGSVAGDNDAIFRSFRQSLR